MSAVTPTQTGAVLALLKARGPQGVTALEALDELGVMRLAARIDDLRREGWEIDTIREQHNGRRYARYVLPQITDTEQRALWGDR